MKLWHLLLLDIASLLSYIDRVIDYCLISCLGRRECQEKLGRLGKQLSMIWPVVTCQSGNLSAVFYGYTIINYNIMDKSKEEFRLGFMAIKPCELEDLVCSYLHNSFLYTHECQPLLLTFTHTSKYPCTVKKKKG